MLTDTYVYNSYLKFKLQVNLLEFAYLVIWIWLKIQF